MTKREKTYKFQVSKTGPGSFGGSKFTSLTEALAYAAYELKQGRAVTIEPIKGQSQ